MGRVIRTGEAVLCPDLVSFPHVIHGRDKLIAAGVRSLACLPLRVDNTPVGSFLCGTGGSTVIGLAEPLLVEGLPGQGQVGGDPLGQQQLGLAEGGGAARAAQGGCDRGGGDSPWPSRAR